MFIKCPTSQTKVLHNVNWNLRMRCCFSVFSTCTRVNAFSTQESEESSDEGLQIDEEASASEAEDIDSDRDEETIGRKKGKKRKADSKNVKHKSKKKRGKSCLSEEENEDKRESVIGTKPRAKKEREVGSADDNSELDENTIRASEDAETEGAEALLGLAQSLFLLGAQPLPEPTAPATTAFQACPSPPTVGKFLLSPSFQMAQLNCNLFSFLSINPQSGKHINQKLKERTKV